MATRPPLFTPPVARSVGNFHDIFRQETVQNNPTASKGKYRKVAAPVVGVTPLVAAACWTI